MAKPPPVQCLFSSEPHGKECESVTVHHEHGVFLSVLRVDIGGFHEHGGVPNFGYTPYQISDSTKRYAQFCADVKSSFIERIT